MTIQATADRWAETPIDAWTVDRAPGALGAAIAAIHQFVETDEADEAIRYLARSETLATRVAACVILQALGVEKWTAGIATRQPWA